MYLIKPSKNRKAKNRNNWNWFTNNDDQHFMAIKKPLCRGFWVVCGRPLNTVTIYYVSVFAAFEKLIE